MTNYHYLLKITRAVHLYMGVFLAPAILFFAMTGALQTFSLQSPSKDGAYVPSHLVQQLAQLHKNQTLVLPPPKKSKSHDKNEDKQADEGHAAATMKTEAKRTALPMKIFFLFVSIGLILSTLTGLYMSYRYSRNKVVVSATLAAGVLIPLLLELL
jgi:hypothetical protein